MKWFGLSAVLVYFWLLFGVAPAYAEYRAYELEVVDIFDCQLKQRKNCKKFRVSTSMNPSLYAGTHGGSQRIGVVMVATWMCRGDTSGYRDVCPMPAAKKPKFNVGDDVQIALKKHITEGWKGKIEVAYFQRSINANVYGVRFSDRKDVYARYFEKDLVKAAAKPTAEASQ